MNHTLKPGETIICEARFHSAAFLLPHILLMFVLIGFITIWFGIASLKNTNLVLTNKRIIGRVGLFSKESLDAPLSKITTVSVRKRMGEAHGVVNISTAAGNFNYRPVANAEEFRDAVMNQIELYDEERIMQQAQKLAQAMQKGQDKE